MKSHRLQDTFATDKFNKGFTRDEVAEMLGHSPAVFRKHYDHWIKGRQDALNKKVIAPWAKVG